MNLDLSTTYLGLKLRHPLMVAAGPMTEEPRLLPELEQAGAAAVVLPSLWEEQIEHYDVETLRMQHFGADSFGEALTYFPPVEDRRATPDWYLRKIDEAKARVSIPVIASLNGSTLGGWTRYAKQIENAGADALELNIYFLATDPDTTSEQIEERYLELVHSVRSATRLPLAVKIGPFFSSLPNMAKRLVRAGADGLVLFNRFLQPDILLESMEVAPNLALSDSKELRLPLRWIAILRDRLTASLAASTGAHTVEDVLKLLAAGADVVQLNSALLKHGAKHLSYLLDGMHRWLVEKEYQSVQQLIGSMSQANCPDPEQFERANYMKALTSFCSRYPRHV